MKVRGKVDFDVEISENEAKRIAIEVIQNLRNWKNSDIIEDGNLCTVTSFSTSHTWYETIVKRPATQEEIFTYQLIKDISNSF